MYIGLALVFIAVGAILNWAVADAVEGVDLSTIGVILMVVGGAALLISVLYDFGSRRRRPAAADDVYAGERVVERRERL